jgi:hypothetical protein
MGSGWYLLHVHSSIIAIFMVLLYQGGHEVRHGSMEDAFVPGCDHNLVNALYLSSESSL